ncbi:Uncharacterised protein [Klebsiella pneumoniae]|nr:Uncharacterised protein [Klebsiella pneumoniae]
MFAEHQAIFRHPLAHLAEKLVKAVAVVLVNDKALHAQAFAQDRTLQQRQTVRAGSNAGAVVIGYQPADRNAPFGIHQR